VTTKPDGRTWAVLMLLSVSLHVPNLGLVPVGALVALFRWSEIRRTIAVMDRSVRWLLPAAATAVATAFLLRLALRGSPQGVLSDRLTAVQVALWLVAFPLMAFGVLVALRIVGERRGLWWIALGSLVGTVAYLGLASINPWKYVFSYPVSLLVLAATARVRTRALPLLICAALVMVSVAFDSRSVGGAAAIAAILLAVFGGRRPQQSSRHAARRRTWLVAGVSIGSLLLLLNAMRLGWLGRRFAAQYAVQTAGGQNVLLGGRVEWNATWSLFTARPMGFGLGTRPAADLQGAAVRAVARAGGDPSRVYYDFAVFNARVDLHSIIADLWFHAGFGGLFLAVVMIVVLARGVIAATFLDWPPGIKAAVYFALGQAAWDLPFSPMAQIDHVVIGLGVGLFAMSVRHDALRAAGGRTPVAVGDTARPGCQGSADGRRRLAAAQGRRRRRGTVTCGGPAARTWPLR
jgi:hypothetical protein